jgi:hypothetical protein
MGENIKFFWTIDYVMRLKSDFHVGSGASLFGGNVHALRFDNDGYPSIGDTEIRGLLRNGGWKLKSWHSSFKDRFIRNFGPRDRNADRAVQWSFTSANFNPVFSNASVAGILGKQSHVRINSEYCVDNLFSNQKAGPNEYMHDLAGRIYSITQADKDDVAFLLACMRVEDCFGHRRTRGYGKVEWLPSKIRRHLPGKKEEKISCENLAEWLKPIFENVQ